MLVDEELEADTDDLGAAPFAPRRSRRERSAEPTRSEIDATLRLPPHGRVPADGLARRSGSPPSPIPEDESRRRRRGGAPTADVAIVVVGTNARPSRSEGFDRNDLALPGRQDELVAAVAAANPRTVVVVNAGSPVLLPWRDEVGAVLLGWFGGQEFGAALADVLLGEPSRAAGCRRPGRRREADVPVPDDDARRRRA